MTPGPTLELRRIFPIDCSNESLFDLFEVSCKETGFTVTKRNTDSILAMRESRSVFSYMVPSNIYDPIKEVILKIQITTVEKHSYKILTITGPKKSSVQSFFTRFEEKLAQSGSHFWVSQFNSAVEVEVPEKAVLLTEGNNASHKADETAYLYFFKMLVNTNYSVGRETRMFLDGFRNDLVEANRRDRPIREADHKSTPHPSTPSAMSLVTRRILSTTEAIEESFASMKHPSNVLVEGLLPRVFASVERFFFEQTGDVLWRLYREEYHEIDSEISSKIIHLTPDECGVRSAFSKLKFFRARRAIVALEGFLESEGTPIGARITPEELLRMQLSLLTEIKLSVLEESSGQSEVLAMDDLTPIYLWLFLGAEKFPGFSYSLLRYCLDSLNEEQRIQGEGRVLALLESAIRVVREGLYDQ